MGRTSVLLVIAAASFLVIFNGVADALKEDSQVFQVCGKVLCQDCTEGWNEWVTGAKPIKGCKVSITCLDDRSRVVHYASDLTDDAGEFEVSVKKYTNGKELKPQNCFLRLVSSPDPVCNIATDFAGGKTGVKLHRPAVVYRDIVKYVLGPFYYSTPMCDEPDTSIVDSNDSKESNY
ncbi:Pollen Ole e 1 allergen and extensin family protein [Abeliophyllum distichum]|uniref:Pollen Ole e 1 allergen and extensin family protein n=1 Tax=Abeliophyllum distichum TaxID=126358 RepID=A0ABD1V8C4_9LAMI